MKRTWKPIRFTDLEVSYDGVKYIDIRVRGAKKAVLWVSKDALQQMLKMFPRAAKRKK